MHRNIRNARTAHALRYPIEIPFHRETMKPARLHGRLLLTGASSYSPAR